MTLNQIIAIVAIVLATWLGRYEPMISPNAVGRLDRWTGRVETCSLVLGDGTRQWIIEDCK
jgi:hypothetical protein